MNFLILGRGKTGSLVAEVARESNHVVHALGSLDNADCKGLTRDKLRDIDVVVDFTVPNSVVGNIEACVNAGKNVVVGTTGWYADVDRVRKLVEQNQTGFVFGANFSIGVNLFFDVARSAAAALRHGYSGQIFERHHVHKKDAPSGTALALRNVVRDASGSELEITSFREGDVAGMHEITLESDADKIYLCHDAKSRRGFAEGAVRAAEWLAGKKGFHDFKDVWREL
jgi:4-hydroxy-tetrahydrodipicolinate reductase